MALLGIELRIKRQFRHADDAIHGRTDFMAHIGEKGAARLVGGFGCLFRRNQGRLRGHDLADIALQNQHANRLSIRLTGGYGPAQKKPAPLPIACLEAAFRLKKRVLALHVCGNPRLKQAQIIRMHHALPLVDRIVEITLGKTEHFLPLTTRFDGAGAEIPVRQDVTRQF